MLHTPWPDWLMLDYAIEENVFEQIYSLSDSNLLKLIKLQRGYLRLLQEYKKEKERYG